MSSETTLVLIFMFIKCFDFSCTKFLELNHESLSSSSQTWPKPVYEQSFEMTPLYRGYTKDGYW